jgi:glycosyltransferase involved in cell wall biosynthesis
MVLDASYTFDTIRRLKIEQSVLCRDLDGFFDHVWSVHPIGDVSGSGSVGSPETHDVGKRHTFIQAQAGRFRGLARFFPLNFAISQLALFWTLRRLARKEKITLLRAGDPLYVGLFGWALARSLRIPFAIRVNCHNDRVRAGSGEPIYPRLLRSIRVEKAIEKFVFPKADLVVAFNQENLEFALHNGAKPDRTSIFPLGNIISPLHLADPDARPVDKELFRRWGVEPGRYLICVSRLRTIKFVDDSVRALAAARRSGHDVKLIIAGEGPMRPALERLAAELGVADHLIMAGGLDQAALAQAYAHAGVVVSPLTGRALTEAAFGAAPIVAYDLDWQGDIIETGVTGELVSFRDIDAFGAATAKLLSDRDCARKMGIAARARAIEMLDPVKLDEHERQTYAQVLGIER